MIVLDDDWKELPEYKGLYKFNSAGGIYSYRKNDLLKYMTNNKGYSYVTLYNKNSHYTTEIFDRKKIFYKHRLIFKYHDNENIFNIFDRKMQIDHVDKDSSNNNIDNLRLTNNKGNQQNTKKRIIKKSNNDNQSKTVGVYYARDRCQWRASIITKEGKHINSKRYNTEEEAICWRKNMEIIHEYINTIKNDV